MSINWEKREELKENLKKSYEKRYKNDRQRLDYLSSRLVSESNPFLKVLSIDLKKRFKDIDEDGKEIGSRGFSAFTLKRLFFENDYFSIEDDTVVKLEIFCSEILNQKKVLLNVQTEFNPKIQISNNDEQSKYENILGTTTINQYFYDSIKNNYQFSKSQFYTAKQNENCQWYGIIYNYDVKRREYEKIKKEVLLSFNKERSFKVSFIIYGFGGCGKSTLQRRLALELRNESFITLWVEDTQFDNFCTTGLNKIKINSTINYLVFLEDWYRLTINDKKAAKKMLNKSKSIKNIRFVIGDREIIGKYYVQNLYNSNNIYYLDNTENEVIVKTIITKNPIWKEISNKIFLNKKNYNSTLFLLLFVLARTYEQFKSTGEIELQEPETAFKNIITSDIKFLYRKFPGLAQTLYYWACIYEKYRIFISYDCFLQIADFFNGNKDVSQFLFNINGKSEIHDKLKIYLKIEKSEEISIRHSEIKVIQFNHDILADLGLSKIKILFPNLGSFDDITKRKILELLPHIKNNDFSVSNLLAIFIRHDKQIFKSLEEITNFIFAFLNNGNQEYAFLNTIPSLEIDKALFNKIINTLIEKRIFPTELWTYLFKNNPETASILLNNKNFLEPHPNIISKALTYSTNQNDIQKACSLILIHDDFLNLPNQLTTMALKISTNIDDIKTALLKVLNCTDLVSIEDALLTIAIKTMKKLSLIDLEQLTHLVLDHEDVIIFHQSVVTTALKFSPNTNDIQNAISNILRNKKLLLIDPNLVVTALRQTESKKDLNHAISIILTKKNIGLNSNLITTALKLCTDKERVKIIATEILTHSDFITIYNQLFVTAIELSKNIEINNDAISKILNHPNIFEINQNMVTVALKKSNNKKDIKKVTSFILNHNNLLQFSNDLIVIAFNSPNSINDLNNAALKIVTYNDILKPSFHMILLKTLKSDIDKSILEKGVERILTYDKLSNLNPVIISTALSISNNKNLTSSKIKYFLKNWRDFNWKIIQTCLLNPNFTKDSYNYVFEISNEINQKSIKPPLYFINTINEIIKSITPFSS